MIEIVISLMILLLEFLAMTYLLSAFFEFTVKKHTYILLITFGILLMLFLNAILSYSEYLFIKGLISAVIINTTICLGFKGHLLHKLIISSVGISLNYIFDYIIILLTLFVLNINIDYLYSNKDVNLILPFLSKIFVLLIYYFVKTYVKKKESQSFLLIECLQIIFFPIVTTYVILYFFDKLLIDKETDVRILISSVGIIIANFILLMLIDKINRNKQIEKEHAMLKQKAELEMNTVNIIMESYKEQRKLTHDFDNHLNIIFQLGCEGKYSELIEYSKANRKISYNTIIVNTNNPIIDTLLSFKYKICIEKNIVMTFNISDLSTLVIDNKDMVIILGNAIDNAIEACEKIINKEKEIHVKLINSSTHLVIAVRNSIESIHKVSIASTKPNSLAHGYGIKNIEHTLNKYKSKPVIGIVDDMFQITAIINNI